jgi:alpha-tubulin suppressor-like RCC1 family protein
VDILELQVGSNFMAFLNSLKQLKGSAPTEEYHRAPNQFQSLSYLCPGKRAVYAFGSAYYGRLGDGQSTRDSLTPNPILCFTETDVLSVQMSSAHILVLLSSGQIYSFGKCHFGQLGLSHEWMDAFTPQLITLRVLIKGISTGTHHSLAFDENGRVFSWGCGFNGALGHGDEATRTTPQLVKSLLALHCIAIAGGEAHSIALFTLSDESGTPLSTAVYSWGKGAQGQLGHGDSRNLLLPKEILFFKPLYVCSILARHDFSSALVQSSLDDIDRPGSCELFTWGSNSHGQLGVQKEGQDDIFLISPEDVTCLHDNRIPDKTIGSTFPLLIPSPSSSTLWKRFSCGGQHCLGEDSEDQLWGWGYGPAFGHFENEYRTCLTPPQSLTLPLSGDEFESFPSPPTITALSCGTRHSLASLSNGFTYSIGMNTSGQLGTGDIEKRGVWTTVEMSQPAICVGSAGGTNSTVLVLEMTQVG